MASATLVPLTEHDPYSAITPTISSLITGICNGPTDLMIVPRADKAKERRPEKVMRE